MHCCCVIMGLNITVVLCLMQKILKIKVKERRECIFILKINPLIYKAMLAPLVFTYVCIPNPYKHIISIFYSHVNTSIKERFLVKFSRLTK